MFRSLRVAGLLASLLLLVALVPGSALASDTSASSSKSAQSAAAAVDFGVLAQLNQIRVQHGLVPLALSPQLTEAARVHSQEMLANGYFAHQSPGGGPFWKRIALYYPQRSGVWSVGENIFWGSGPVTATESMDAWMASAGHRANILDPTWRQIGIAAVSSPDAPGAFGGLAGTVITTDFGVRG